MLCMYFLKTKYIFQQLRNVITTSGRSSYFLYDDNGKISGTAGQFQDILNILKVTHRDLILYDATASFIIYNRGN